ncbi:MAG: alpha/beta fold hydrolase [Pseudomonadota bacterium]
MIDLTLPRLGETMDEGRIATWLIKPGDAFKRGDVILEVETDKTLVEVPALETGVLVEILEDDGELVDVGATIARIEVEGKDDAPTSMSETVGAKESQVSAAPSMEPAFVQPENRTPASPNARRIARETKIDINAIPGSGRNGRVTGDDVSTFAPAVEAKGGTAERSFAFVHGLFAGPSDFSSLSSRVSRSGAKATAVAIPWSAGSGGDPMSGIASALASHLKDATDLVGHSFGAALVLSAAASRAVKPRSLTLISPFGLGSRVDQSFLDGMLGAASSSALAREAEKAGGPGLSQEAIETLLDAIASDRAAYLALIPKIARGSVQQIDLLGDLERVDCTVRIVLGWQDRVLPWYEDGTLRRLPPKVAVHFLDAGHVAHATHAAEIAAILSSAA